MNRLKITTRLGLTALLLGSSGIAAAQEPAPTLFAPLATTDRTTDHTAFNTSLGASFYGDGGPDFGARVDLFGQYLAPAGYGGYASLPVAYLSGNDESETALGNVELGGLYGLRAGDNAKVLLRGGVVLPTADDELEGALTNLATMSGRLTDLTSAYAETTWLRVSASPLYRQGQMFARADVGFDLAVDEPEGAEIDPMVRANLAGGIQMGKASIAGELATVGTTGDVDDGEDRFLHTIGVSAAFDAGSVRPYGGLVIPIDNALADFADLNFVLMAGLEVPIATR
jgi:hypothetical protein